MIECYCNKYGVGLKIENCRNEKEFLSFYKEIGWNLCEDCLKDVIGNTKYCKPIKKEIER